MDKKDNCQCIKCGNCCRLATSEFSYDQLKQRAARGDKFARDFVSVFVPYKTEEEAKAYVEQIRKLNGLATHNCYAYIYGINGEYAKNSDDGEPSQTAGAVIYDVLKKNNLTNVLAVVTRYFGGIKLGAGGLVRAYSSSTSEAVKIAEILKIEKCVTLSLTVTYQNFNLVSKLFDNFELINKVFTDRINLEYQIPEKDVENLIIKAKDLTKNQLIYEIKESRYVEM